MSEHTTGGSDTRSEEKTLLDYMVKGVYDVAKRLIAQQRDLHSQYSLLCKLTSYVDRLTTWQRDTDDDDDLDELFANYSPIDIAQRIDEAYEMSITQALIHNGSAPGGICYPQFTQAGEPRPTIYPGRAAILTYFLADRERSPLAKGLSEAAQAELGRLTAELDAYYQAHKGVDQWELINGYMGTHVMDIKREIVDIKPTKPNAYCFPLTAVDDVIFDPDRPHSPYEDSIATGKGGAKSGIYTYITVDPHDGRPLTKTDKTVHNALWSIWQKQDGRPDRGYATLPTIVEECQWADKPDSEGKVLSSLETMNEYEIWIDNHAEIDAHLHYPDVRKTHYGHGRLVSYQTQLLRIGGHITEGVRFLPPMLCEYAAGRKQISAVSLCAIKYGTGTDVAAALLDHILRDIAIRGRNKAQITMRYDTLCNAAMAYEGYQRKRALAKAEEILERLQIYNPGIILGIAREDVKKRFIIDLKQPEKPAKKRQTKHP